MQVEDKILICKICALVILSDLELSPSEIGALRRLMDAYDLSPAERREALNVTKDDDIAELVKSLPPRVAKSELVNQLARAIRADGKIDEREREVFVRVTRAIGLGESAASAVLG